MIIIKEKNNKVCCEPCYILVYNYMIGDADGSTTREAEVSLENPYIERYVTLMNSLRPVRGSWGFMLQEEDLTKAFEEGQITEDDYNFLLCMAFAEGDFFVEEHNKDYSYEFVEGVRSETEYSFLVFEGIEIYYLSKFGYRHLCEIVDDEDLQVDFEEEE